VFLIFFNKWKKIDSKKELVQEEKGEGVQHPTLVNQNRATHQQTLSPRVDGW
jgi:hypothetical protein